METAFPVLLIGVVPLLLFWAGARARGAYRTAVLALGVLVVAGAALALYQAQVAQGWDALGWFIIATPLLFAGAALVTAWVWGSLRLRMAAPPSGWRGILAALCVFAVGWGLSLAILITFD